MRARQECWKAWKPYFPVYSCRLLSAVSLVYRYVLRLNQVKPDPLHAVAEVEHSGGAVAQVHDAIAHIRAAVIDPDDDPLAIFKVGHLYKGSQRQRTMSGCELEHVEILAAGCGLAMKLFAIPGRIAYLVGFGFSFSFLSCV